MILENGVIRTLDPSLPTCGALAIAGSLVTGGVGTHEWALPTPDRAEPPLQVGRPGGVAQTGLVLRPAGQCEHPDHSGPHAPAAQETCRFPGQPQQRVVPATAHDRRV